MGEVNMDVNEIMKLLPHRYPFLFVDRVIYLEPEKKIVAIKNVTMDEPFFQGHFPGAPVMPGVLIIEALAQTGGILLLAGSNRKVDSDKLVYFMSIDKAKFRRPVVPGDQLKFEVSILRAGSKVSQFEGKAYVEDNLVAEGILTAMLADKK